MRRQPQETSLIPSKEEIASQNTKKTRALTTERQESQTVPLPTVSEHVKAKIETSREKKLARDKLEMSYETSQPAQKAKPTIRLPKDGPAEQKCKDALRKYELKSPVGKSVEDIKLLLMDLSEKMAEIFAGVEKASRPKSDAFKRLLHEQSTLTLLKKCTSREGNEDRIASLVKSRHIFEEDYPAMDWRSRVHAARGEVGRAIKMLNERFEKRQQAKIAYQSSARVIFRKHGPKKCLEALRGQGRTDTCQIPASTLEDYQRKKCAGSPSMVGDPKFDLDDILGIPEVASTRTRPATDEENIGEEFTMEELEKGFQLANKNSAPGPDRLSLKMLLLGGVRLKRWLLAVFEELRVLQAIPACWTEGEVQLIYKKGDKMDPSNWRPITLLSNVYKLYMSLLSRRIHAHDRKLKQENGKGIFLESQRGFMPGVSGCTDNAALLKHFESLIEPGNPLWELLIDFKDAFGSMDHNVLWIVMAWLNVPSYMVNIVKSAYSNARIRIRCADGVLTADVVLEKGVAQGCPFSPALFAMVLEPLLRLLSAIGRVRAKNGTILDAGAFADDIVVVAGSKARMESCVLAVELFSNLTGIEVNVKKTIATVVSISKSGQRSARDPKLTYGPAKMAIPAASGSTTVMYLGGEAGGSGSTRNTVKRVKQDLNDSCKLLHESNLFPSQKHLLLRSFITAKARYVLSIWPLRAAAAEGLDKVVRKWAKLFEGLRKGFVTGALRSSRDIGGLGYGNLASTASLEYAVPFVKRLIKGDKLVQNAEKVALQEEASRLRILQGLSVEPMKVLVSNEFVGMMDKRTPPMLRNTFSLLRRADIEFHQLDTDFPIMLRRSESGLKYFPLKSLRSELNELLDADYRNEWQSKILEGEPIDAFRNVPLAPASANGTWMKRPGLFSERARTQAMLAVTNNIDCTFNRNRLCSNNASGLSNACPRCHAQMDNPAHVLNMCPVNYPLMSARHDAVVRVAVNHLKRVNPSASIAVDSTVERSVSGSRLRPDVVQVGLKGKFKSVILDVKCPFPFRETAAGTFVDRSNARNLAKYANLAKGYESKYGSCLLGTIIVPSVGPIPKVTFLVLKAAGFSDREATRTLREMSIALVRASAKFSRMSSGTPLQSSSPP